MAGHIVAWVVLCTGFVGQSAYYEARVHEMEGRHEQALTQFAELGSGIGPIALYAQVKAADCLVALGDVAQAEALYKAILEERPEGPWARMAEAHLAMLLTGQRRYAEAAVYFDRVLDVPVHPWWYESFAWAGHENMTRVPGLERRGHAYFEEILLNNIFRAKRRDASRVLAGSDRFEEQLLGALGLARTDEQTAGHALMRTLATKAEGDPQRTAYVAFVAGALGVSGLPSRSMLDAWPDEAFVRLGLAQWITREGYRGGFDTARRHLDILLERWPESAEAVEGLFQYGFAMQRNNRHREAIAAFTELAERYPHHRRADACLLRAARIAEQHLTKAEAIPVYERLAEAHPTARLTAEGLFQLASMHQGDANLQGLMAALERARDGGLGHYHGHRAARWLSELRPQDETGVRPVPHPTANRLVAAIPVRDWSERPLPDAVKYHVRTMRLDFFGGHGFEEAEWEALDLALADMDEVWEAHRYRVMAEAGLAHSATQYARAAGWGIENGRHTPDLQRLYWARVHWDHVMELSRETGVDPFLILAVGRQESTFRPALTSVAGARGLMQVMPATARWLADVDGAISHDDIARLDDPKRSLRLGAHYLRRMLAMWDGNIVYAIASYNGGPGNVRKWVARSGHLPLEEWIEAIPFSETQDYVKRVLGNYAAYHSLYPPEGTGPGRSPGTYLAEEGAGADDEKS